MSSAAINSALEAAVWFTTRARKENVSLDHGQLQNLLFLAQVHFALNNNMQYLMPTIFVCTRHGFAEPTLETLLPAGLPSLPQPKFSTRINAFLDLIWKKYAVLPVAELENFVKTSDSYLKTCALGHKQFTMLEDMAADFKSSLNPRALSQAGVSDRRKILISQNGPVVVSKWQPCKLNSKTDKENSYA